MKVLLSIKPEYAFKIFDGEKKFEFRKAIFKKANIKTVVVYASSPVQRVIGEFEIDDIFSLEPRKLWEKTKEFSGISEEFFFAYFAERKVGYAIKIKKTRKYRTPLLLKDSFNNAAPPQSYMYI
ncbi:Predicted transcriptional regulator, contains an HTH and PUA-like domains [Chitinophaga costaii]|uniref:Predicted transcriptional regulator, contains an HTH and PUA-like domains n=1 Tax=Chitinophaga costaii TaxID=1335309 RepID=A0A1C4F523_9BACT|nr:ASCH domain-containing protein [Chitinophaga costaii]PUZ21283.1 ASCH domain-containing protein [Chitinophaga costaii]SCC51077.1 Predicted transcriptional regulator, contains an HTH and PUA-like domains [Chitinophaga costaii]